MFEEDDCLPISALQHLVFCERQCALIHVEGVWRDNRLTVEGTHLHERVDLRELTERRGDVRVVRGLALRSLSLGLSGRADVVEFRRAPDTDLYAVGGEACGFDDGPGRWSPMPVEYKRGRPKQHAADRVQLCAQALCLEEMLGCQVAEAALYYGEQRRRLLVTIDASLRTRTTEAVERLRHLVTSGRTPQALRKAKCAGCSLQDLCLPGPASSGRSALAYLCAAVLASVNEEDA